MRATTIIVVRVTTGEGVEIIDNETVSEMKIPLSVNTTTTSPTVDWRYGQHLLKVPLCELLDRPTAKESHKEAIGYAVEDISDRFK